MNDLEMRINSIIQIIASESSKVDKVVASLQVFSGLDITHFSSQKQKAIYKCMRAVNSITNHYPMIKTYDDYKMIVDIDLSKILKNIQQLCLKLI